MNFGLPYQGSKNKIARDIVSRLPSGERLIDVFSGGCAITHAALLEGRWESYLANDIRPTPALFRDAIYGKYRDESRWISREAFRAAKDEDAYIATCWSFGNNCDAYMYAKEIESWKRALHYAVYYCDLGPFGELGINDLSPTGDTPHSRSLSLKRQINEVHLATYKRAIAQALMGLEGEELEQAIMAGRKDIEAQKARLRGMLRSALQQASLKVVDVDRHLGTNGMAGHYFGVSQWELPTPEAYAKMQQIMPALDRPYSSFGNYLQSLQSLESLERLQRLQSLESPERLQRLQRLEVSQKDYRQLEIRPGDIVYCDPPYIGTRGYGVSFDHAAFYEWCESIPAPCFISEYNMPEDRFAVVWKTELTRKYSATKASECIEKLYVPRRWAHLKGRIYYKSDELFYEK